MTNTVLGTPLNVAPEMISCDSKIMNKTDLWSIGIVFYWLLFGEHPYFALSLHELHLEIKKNNGKNMKFPKKPEISE